MRRPMPALWVALLLCLLPPAAVARAAAPPNDDRAAATMVALPVTVTGTTEESTREAGEPESFCGRDGGSVWYRVTPRKSGRVIVSLVAHDAREALVDVYRARGGQITDVTCVRARSGQEAALGFRARAGNVYLVRVSHPAGSSPSAFDLALRAAPPEPRPPGPPLPSRGARGVLDRVLDPLAVYRLRMREGVTYRIHLASGEACTPLEIYPAGTRSFATATPVKRLPCGGYTLFTPRGGQGGVHSIVARAPRRRGSFPFRLTGGRAGIDDTTPGRALRHTVVRGALSGSGLDVTDLYRVDVKRRSTLELSLRSRARFELTLLRDTGAVLRTASGRIRTRVRPGRYLVAVRARPRAFGSYTLTVRPRAVTRTRVLVDGRRSAHVAPGRAVHLGVRVRPSASGRVRVVIERFDPFEGYQFARRYIARVSRGGRQVIKWRPPSVGRYRVRATFEGTRRASSSRSGYARIRVLRPL